MLKFHQALSDAFNDFNEVDDITTEACNGFIRVQYEDVTFTMQSGDVSQFGVNGVQVEELLKYSVAYLELLNSHLHSSFNDAAIGRIKEAIKQLDLRTEDRIKRNVEGTHKQ